MSDYWKNRAMRAENAVRYVMWTSPGRMEKTAQEFADRIHLDMERNYPDQVARYSHGRIEVFRLAESCTCNPDDPAYESWHCESDGDGEELCSRGFLGYVCDFCTSDDGDGPDWKPDGVEWPCQIIRELDKKIGRTDGD